MMISRTWQLCRVIGKNSSAFRQREERLSCARTRQPLAKIGWTGIATLPMARSYWSEISAHAPLLTIISHPATGIKNDATHPSRPFLRLSESQLKAAEKDGFPKRLRLNFHVSHSIDCVRVAPRRRCPGERQQTRELLIAVTAWSFHTVFLILAARMSAHHPMRVSASL